MKCAFPRVGQALLVAFGLAQGANAGAFDLSGHWYFETPRPAGHPAFPEIVQAGDSVAIPSSALFTYEPSFAATGTLAGDHLSIGVGPFFLSAMVEGGSRILAGSMAYNSPPSSGASPFFAMRCECFDGNEDDGDGCDSHCRIEPCFDCPADGACTPSADGAGCDDRRDCTTGETCSAATCGNGSAVASCVDMTGRWRVATTETLPVHSISDVRDVVQEQGLLRFLDADTGATRELGTIDPGTGAFSIFQLRPEASFVIASDYPLLNLTTNACGIAFDGVVAADGSSFSGSGTESGGYQMFVHGGLLANCTSAEPFTQGGARCTPGQCTAGADECSPCMHRGPSGTCEVGPRSGCLRSQSPRKSSLLLLSKDGPTADRLRWKWMAGEALDPALLGRPTEATGTQVCVFDETGPTPQLLFSTYRDPYGFEAKAGAPFSLGRNTDAGKEIVAWKPGDDGQSSMVIDGRGGALSGLLADGLDFALSNWFYGPVFTGLPAVPLPTTLRVQATMDRGGACFESVFDSGGVRRNAGGTFKAVASE